VKKMDTTSYEGAMRPKMARLVDIILQGWESSNHEVKRFMRSTLNLRKERLKK
jgi:hypothetical protein